MNKMTVVGIAALLIGSSAALAQPNGYGSRYARQEVSTCQNPNHAYDLEQFRSGHTENVPVCVGDPATGVHITREQYLSKYPWSDVRTWVYNPALDVWADNTPNRDYLFAQSQNGAPVYSQNSSPSYRSNNSQDYRDRRNRN
jgi:hypothetical protein